MSIEFHACPTCGVEAGKPCRTPKGRLARSAHDTRPFGVWLDSSSQGRDTPIGEGFAFFRWTQGGAQADFHRLFTELASGWRCALCNVAWKTLQQGENCEVCGH